MKNRLKKIIPFSAATLLLAGGGIFLADSPLSADAENATPAVGTVMTTQTDFYGNQVELPVEFDGEKYILADYTRNIYVHDGTRVNYIDSLLQNPTNYPVYTSKSGVFEDRMAVSVYHNVLKSYDFYVKENIGEDYPGINGANDNIAGNVDNRTDEIPLRIFVHMNAEGYRFNAAFTTSSMEGFFEEKEEGYVIVGDGNPNSTYYNMYAQGTALDVIAHEYQHGVTNYISGLEYEGESGALDEAFSDIFGMLVEEHDLSEEDFWLMGEDATLDQSGLRSIKDPQGDQGKTMDDLQVCRKYHYGGWHDDSCDYDNVHYNSTIISHLQYTAWAELPEYFTRERIARLWYKTLTLLNSNETFNGFAQKWHQAAVDLNFSEEAVNVLDYSLTVNGFKGFNVRKVTFQNADGTFLESKYVKQGETVTAPTPYREPTVEYEYVFTGWDKDLSNITADVTVTAVFQELLRTFTVRFLNYDGTVLKEVTVKYGEAADPPPAPTRESTEQFNYVFKHWDGDWQQILCDVDIPASFEERARKYTVKYVIGGEERNDVLTYGAALALPALPEGYEGWYFDEACTVAATDTTVFGDLTLYAKKAEDDNIALILALAGAAALLTGGVIALIVIVKKKKAK